MTNDSPPVVVRRKRRVFDGFFKLDELTVSHRKLNGAMSADETFLIFERGDSVAALLVERETGNVIAVEQFRAPTLEKSRNHGWMIEAVAGMIDAGETPDQAIVREVLEETGYRIEQPELVATFFASPGGSSERIFVYYAVVTAREKGAPAEAEDIRLLSMSLDELFDRMDRGEIEDPKLIIAAHHAKRRGADALRFNR
jgi:ADP-ribose pyrophosphatase